MGLPSWFSWMSFAIGILFSMFIMPLLSQILGRLKSGAAVKKAV